MIEKIKTAQRIYREQGEAGLQRYFQQMTYAEMVLFVLLYPLFLR